MNDTYSFARKYIYIYLSLSHGGIEEEIETITIKKYSGKYDSLSSHEHDNIFKRGLEGFMLVL